MRRSALLRSLRADMHGRPAPHGHVREVAKRTFCEQPPVGFESQPPPLALLEARAQPAGAIRADRLLIGDLNIILINTPRVGSGELRSPLPHSGVMHRIHFDYIVGGHAGGHGEQGRAECVAATVHCARVAGSIASLLKKRSISNAISETTSFVLSAKWTSPLVH